MSPSEPSITVDRETPLARGWSFDITVAPAPDDHEHARPFTLSLRLAWVDYERWSRGTVRPEQIAREIIAHLVANNRLENRPAHLDAARLRRLDPTLDAALAPPPPGKRPG